MTLEQRASDQAQPTRQPDDTAANSAAPGGPLARIGKSGEVGCVFAGLAVRIGNRSPDDYAAFLEEL